MSQDDMRLGRDWHDIAEEASRELDSSRLMELVEELDRALDGRDKKPVQSESPPSPKITSTSTSGGRA